jgi:hypothetical protein
VHRADEAQQPELLQSLDSTAGGAGRDAEDLADRLEGRAGRELQGGHEVEIGFVGLVLRCLHAPSLRRTNQASQSSGLTQIVIVMCHTELYRHEASPEVALADVTRRRRSPTSLILRLLDFVDRAGNKLPHPFWLFVILSVLVVAASWLLAALDVSVISPADGKEIAVQSVVSGAGVEMVLGDLIKNFVNFPPLGLIVVVMLGVAIADKTGLLPALMRAALTRVPAKLVTFAVALTCMFSHVAGDAAFVVMIPLGMIAFRTVGRSPIIGAVVAYVAVGGASSISPIIEGSDAIFAGLTTSAAHTIDPNYLVTPVSNWYFSAASSLLLAVTITIVTETIVARRVSAMNAAEPELTDTEELPDMSLSASRCSRARSTCSPWCSRCCQPAPRCAGTAVPLWTRRC